MHKIIEPGINPMISGVVQTVFIYKKKRMLNNNIYFFITSEYVCWGNTDLRFNHS